MIYLSILIYYGYLFFDGSKCDEISVTGIEHKSVKLKCDFATSDTTDSDSYLTWSDFVYNDDERSVLIFDSRNNSDLAPYDLHPNYRDYEIDMHFSLTINSLKLDDDPGIYICEKYQANNTETISYFLSVGSKPTCWSSSEKQMEGEEASLVCEMRYSGNTLPRLAWKRGEEVLESKDHSEIRLTNRSLSLKPSWEDHKQRYSCVASFGDFLEECYLYLDVLYGVRDVAIEPTRRNFEVGDELRCSAFGNPLPNITIIVHSIGDKTTSQNVGTKVMDSVPNKVHTIPASWQSKQVALSCAVTNQVLNETHRLRTNLTIDVATTRKVKIKAVIDKALDKTYIVVVGILIVAGLFLFFVIIGMFIKKHREKKRKQKIQAAKDAEANKKKEEKVKRQN